MSDNRRWHTFTVPFHVAQALELAVWKCMRMGANSQVEALEWIFGEFNATHQISKHVEAMIDDRPLTPYLFNQIIAYIDSGFCCIRCGHSRIETHHMVPRGARGTPQWDDVKDLEDGVDNGSNLAPLCRQCHRRIQPRWRQELARLREDKKRAKWEVENIGWVATKPK